jgi:hypothetical protein
LSSPRTKHLRISVAASESSTSIYGEAFFNSLLERAVGDVWMLAIRFLFWLVAVTAGAVYTIIQSGGPDPAGVALCKLLQKAHPSTPSECVPAFEQWGPTVVLGLVIIFGTLVLIDLYRLLRPHIAAKLAHRKQLKHLSSSAGLDLTSMGLTPPANVRVTDEIAVQSLAIVFPNLANSPAKGSLFRRSWTAFPNNGPGKRRFSYHQYFVAVENKSMTKTLRGVRLVAESIKGAGGQILNREFPCERTGTGSADIPPKAKDYYLIGEGVDESDAGTFQTRIVPPDEYERILADIELRERQYTGFVLSTSKGQRYSLLKNDGYRLAISAYADDNPPVTATLIIDAKDRIQLWLTGDADT